VDYLPRRMRTRRGALTSSVALLNVFDKSAHVYGAPTDSTPNPATDTSRHSPLSGQYGLYVLFPHPLHAECSWLLAFCGLASPTYRWRSASSSRPGFPRSCSPEQDRLNKRTGRGVLIDKCRDTVAAQRCSRTYPEDSHVARLERGGCKRRPSSEQDRRPGHEPGCNQQARDLRAEVSGTTLTTHDRSL
jgi:hypothetical protein